MEFNTNHDQYLGSRARHWTAAAVLVVLALMPFVASLLVGGNARHASVPSVERRLLDSVGTLTGIAEAEASTLPAYSADVVGRSFDHLTIQQGKAVTFWVDFQNTGSATWKNSGSHFVALNVADPAGRASAFHHRFWPLDYRPARLASATVAPGSKTRVTFALQAPAKAGEYLESFQLVAENLTWIPGSQFTVPIRVVPPPPAYRAEIVGRSFGELSLQPNQAATFWVDIRNTGSATWKNSGSHFVALNVADPAGRASAFHHRFWPLDYRPAKIRSASVPPKKTTRVSFALQAPSTPGDYTESFQLVAEHRTWIDGSEFTIPIHVASPQTHTAAGEPSLDVGLRAITEPIEIRANGVAHLTQNGNAVADIAADAIVTLSFANGTYTVTLPTGTMSDDEPYTVTPESSDTILEAVNFENRPEWNPELNDNRFRGNLRIEHATATGRTWLINTLPLESYIRGIAEASNSSPTEYLRALLIAARTYAHFHILTPTKHANEHFTVDATNDQVYRGYNFELRSPNVAQAALETAGIEVTYNGSIVITPYFSQSDGRTRSWGEVWSGGPYPWLVSVPDPACTELALLGHGVGMSGRGAYAMALDGKTAQEILTYYYTGVTLQTVY